VLKVLTIFGTRPEAIKLAPVIRELQKHPNRVVSKVCVTAQHRQMLDQVLRLFDIMPEYDLNLMEDNQSPTRIASAIMAIMARLEPILRKERPDWVLVRGPRPRWPQWTWLAEATQQWRPFHSQSESYVQINENFENRILNLELFMF